MKSSGTVRGGLEIGMISSNSQAMNAAVCSLRRGRPLAEAKAIMQRRGLSLHDAYRELHRRLAEERGE